MKLNFPRRKRPDCWPPHRRCTKTAQGKTVIFWTTTTILSSSLPLLYSRLLCKRNRRSNEVVRRAAAQTPGQDSARLLSSSDDDDDDERTSKQTEQAHGTPANDKRQPRSAAHGCIAGKGPAKSHCF